MGVQYRAIDNEEVSAQWYAVLVDMRAAGVYFNVNEGHRTMARQWYFWNLYRAGRGNLAAYPSPYAPHIRTGRIDHAIDFGNDGAVFSWLASKGLNPARTVRGESWHIEVSAAELNAYYARHGKPDNSRLRGLGPRRRKAASRLLYHRRKRNKEARTGKGKLYRMHDRYADRWRKVLVVMWRAAKGKQKKILADVINDRNGEIG